MENFVDENSFVPLHQTIFTREQEQMKEEDFPFEVVDQSKPTSFLQDFHHLDHDHQFDHHGSTSSNPLLGIQTSSSCINNAPFEHCSYQENMVDFYESKPLHLMNHHFQAAENPYFTRNHHHHHHQEINLVDEHDTMDLEQNNMMMMRMIPFDYPPTEIINKPMNFVMPDEVSCVSADTNDCYRAMSFNKTKPFLTRKLSSSSSSSSWKGIKKTTLVKGQWTSEEDRFVININLKINIT